MKHNNCIKSLIIFGLFFEIIMLISIYSYGVTQYEVSIYQNIPIYVWISLSISVIIFIYILTRSLIYKKKVFV